MLLLLLLPLPSLPPPLLLPSLPPPLLAHSAATARAVGQNLRSTSSVVVCFSASAEGGEADGVEAEAEGEADGEADDVEGEAEAEEKGEEGEEKGEEKGEAGKGGREG